MELPFHGSRHKPAGKNQYREPTSVSTPGGNKGLLCPPLKMVGFPYVLAIWFRCKFVKWGVFFLVSFVAGVFSS